jgi:hypothetical protein
MSSTIDLSDIEAENSVIGPRCTVPSLAQRLTDADAEKYREALARPKKGPGMIEDAAIARWLGRRDVRVAGQTIGRHRSGQCGCRE